MKTREYDAIDWLSIIIVGSFAFAVFLGCVVGPVIVGGRYLGVW